MNKPHLHAEEIIAWANGAEIEVRYDSTFEWMAVKAPMWHEDKQYRIKPQPVIKKMYMHYDAIERHVKDDKYDFREVPQTMYSSNSDMSDHLEFTFTDGKLTSVEILK